MSGFSLHSMGGVRESEMIPDTSFVVCGQWWQPSSSVTIGKSPDDDVLCTEQFHIKSTRTLRHGRHFLIEPFHLLPTVAHISYGIPVIINQSPILKQQPV